MKKITLSIITILTLGSSISADDSFGLTINYSNTSSVSYTVSNEIGYLTIPELQKSDSETIDEAFRVFKSSGVKEIALNLKDNSLTTLSGIDAVVDNLLGNEYDEKVHTVYKTNSGKTKIETINKRESSINSVKIIVNINENTSGGAEHLISALKAYKPIKVYGNSSAGYHGLLYKNYTNVSYGVMELTNEFYNVDGLTYGTNGILSDYDLSEGFNLIIYPEKSDNVPDFGLTIYPIKPYSVSDNSELLNEGHLEVEDKFVPTMTEEPEPEIYITYE